MVKQCQLMGYNAGDLMVFLLKTSKVKAMDAAR